MSFNCKRFWIGSIFGFLSGLLCYFGGIYLVGIGNNLTNFLWIIHGVLIGAIVGLLFPFNIFMRGGKMPLILSAYVLSILFGILIEFFTSIVFQARQMEKK